MRGNTGKGVSIKGHISTGVIGWETARWPDPLVRLGGQWTRFRPSLDKYHLLIVWKIWLKSDEISLFRILLLALKIWRKMWSTISFSSSGKTAQKGTEKWIGLSNLFLFCSYFPPLENVIRIELIGSTYGTSTLLLWFSSHFPQY